MAPGRPAFWASMIVEVFSDVVCPWCYLGTRRLHRALEGLGLAGEVEVVHRSFQLDPGAPAGSSAAMADVLAERYGLSGAEVATMQADMARRAAADGLAYAAEGLRSGNTFDAHRLLQLARARGRQPDLVEVLFRAHFAEGRSVFEPVSLEALAVEAGLERADVAGLLAGDAYASEVRADLATARAYQITGVPFFVVDGRLGVPGAQPVEVLARVVDEARAAS